MNHTRNVILAALVGLVLIELADTKKPAESAPPVPVVNDGAGSPIGSPDLGSPVPDEPENYESPSGVFEWQAAVFPVRQRYGNVISQGTAVSLGDGLLVSAAHIFESNTTPEVEVNGQWVPAGLSRIRGQDVAYLTIRDTSLPRVEVRKPQYGEQAYAFGLRTRKAMCGMIADDDALALFPEEGGVNQGDSGGGVFGEDGKLLGTIRSHRAGNQRVVQFTTLNPPVPYAKKQQQPYAASEEPPKPPVASQPCPGGVCPAPSY